MSALKAPYSILADTVLYPKNVFHIFVVKAKFQEYTESLVSMLRSGLFWHKKKKQ